MYSLVLNIFISFFILLLLNFILSKYKILIDNPKLSQHKYKHDNIIPLSGGTYFLLTYLVISSINQAHVTIIPYLFPFFIIGLYADISEKFSPKLRLLFQLLFIIVIVNSFKISINSIDLQFFDYLLNNKYFNFVFVLFCLITILNGYNLMDGLNGFVSGQMLMIITTIFSIIYMNNLDIDNNLFINIEIFFFICLIFFLFNLIGACFLGDNGIYIFSIFLSLLIINFTENTQGLVSPLIAAIFLWYPAYENLFSILRRLKKNKLISEPDVLHLHILLKNFIYKSYKHKFSYSKVNSITAILINISLIPNFLLGAIWYNSSTKLTILIIFQIFIYMFVYFLLLKKSN